MRRASSAARAPGSSAHGRWRPAIRRFGLELFTAGALACAPSGTDAGKLPPNIPDPATVQTPAGALAFYRRVLALLPPAFDWFIAETAVFTDEFASLPTPSGQGGRYTGLDSRFSAVLPSTTYGFPDSYTRFHQLRGQAREARGFLASYALPPDSTKAYNIRDLRAQLFALEGYADIFLADFYCSGIPLSTVDFQGDYTLTPGFPTNEVYLHAAELFDSALGLVTDSARFRALAAVGKGRALLGAGQSAAAAAAVAAVPTDYQYQVSDDSSSDQILRAFAGNYALDDPLWIGTPGMGDREGVNGLPYVSSHDPRVPVDTLGPGPYGGTMYFPAKYPMDGPVLLPLASGIEARLIEAEAALQAGNDAWLPTLNALRQTVGLPDTTDPGTAAGRVDLLFQERAFWLYLTAHREGDLRRLIRQYGRDPLMVYPTGGYPGGPGRYGDLIVAPVPAAEQELNPKYSGCIHLQA